MQRLVSSSHGKDASFHRLLFLVCFIIPLCSGVALPRAARAYTTAIPTTCTSATTAKPDSGSLLIVLLDRSGSLGIGGSSGTDTQNYSASATDALSDLWPGPMAVIPFYAKGNQLIYTSIGPLLPAQRTALKNKVNNLPSQGWTPLAEAMQTAQNLLSQNGTPPGSRIVIITDGQPQTPADPNGVSEEHAVLTKDAPQFCREGVSVSPFGLTIAENSNAANFLHQVAAETGGVYQHIADASELGGAVISLYAAWDGLEFNRISKDQAHDDYPIVTDSSTQSAYILTFYQNGQNERLTTASGQAASYTSSSDGRHYEIDTLNTPIPPATYTVRTTDPSAVVYDLVNSTRTLQLVQPTANTTAITGQSITITAHLVDTGTGPIVPGQNQLAFFQATVTETVRGQTLPAQTVDLTQAQPGSDLFTGKFAVPKDAKLGNTAVTIGTLQIKVTATYQGVIHTTSPLTIPVIIPKYIPLPPPPPKPCHGNLWQCSSQQTHTLIIGAGILLLFLLLLLFIWWLWYRQPAPSGTIYGIPPRGKYDPEEIAEVRLGSKRRLEDYLFHRSVITSEELSRHPDAKGDLFFNTARFELVARNGKAAQNGQASGGRGMYIRQTQGNSTDIKVRSGAQETPVAEETPLGSNSSIIVDKVEVARYS